MNVNVKATQKKSFQIDASSEQDTFYLRLSGQFRLSNLSAFTSEADALIRNVNAQSIVIDFSDIEYLDSAAALAFITIKNKVSQDGIDCSLVHLSDEARRIFSIISEAALAKPPLKPEIGHLNIFVQIGRTTIHIAKDLINFITFIGELIVAAVYTIRHPHSLRWKDVLFYMHRAGVDGLPIVGLIGLLTGLIIAFMSFLQLKQIGANIYVPSLVSFAMVKELGPLMTAILVAGRSGSAYAAEIGTMVVNEEVDALVTMGFDPIRFLAIPKVLATILVVPILTIYADFFGIIGGLIIGVTSLDLTVSTYVTQSIKTIKVFDIVTSLIKAGVFAALIAGIGCQRGFQVRAGAQDVGKFTTSAVVTAVFMIVLADSIFAIMFYYIK